MKRTLLGIIVSLAVMPMLAQVEISSIYKTYTGKMQVGIASIEERDTDKGRDATATLTKKEEVNHADITLGGFGIGNFIFTKIPLSDIVLTSTDDGYSFVIDKVKNIEAQLTKKDGTGSYYAQISIDPDAKGTIKNGQLIVEMTINFNGSKLYTRFTSTPISTGIHSIQTESKGQDEIYDLTGKRVNKPRKGIYIINGKKVVM